MEELLKLYAQLYSVEFIARLGEGKDGEVFQTNVARRPSSFTALITLTGEIRAYRILDDLSIKQIAGHNTPAVLVADDTIWAIEMTIVKPPFILDFVSAHTDEEIEHLGFMDDVVAEREPFWEERFSGRWPGVQKIRNEFHRLTGLTLLDLSHNNIRFE